MARVKITPLNPSQRSTRSSINHLDTNDTIEPREDTPEHSQTHIIILHLDSSVLRQFPTGDANMPRRPSGFMDEAFMDEDWTPALSKDGKRKSASWGGARHKGQPATSQGQTNLPLRRSTRVNASASTVEYRGETLVRPAGTGNSTIDNLIQREASNKSHDDIIENPPKRRKSNRGSAYIEPGGSMMDEPPMKQGYTAKGLAPIAKYGFTHDEPPHPDLARHINRGTATAELRAYYDGMDHRVVNPFAGIVHEKQFEGLFRELVPDYNLQSQYHWTAIKNNPQFDEYFSEQSVRANRDYQEENFQGRPAVRIPIPDHLKSMLVDDWENVTKNQMLVPIPSPKPVNQILNDYMAAERPKRLVPNAQGKNGPSPQAEILAEVVEGLREYFEKCLGRILLYKFERNQYLTVFNQINSGEGEFAGKEIGDIYGAEHFCRLLVTLPELIAQTNMNRDAVGNLRDEIGKITLWLGKNAVGYFASSYEHPGQDYIENARHS